jgi:hypothetical protein
VENVHAVVQESLTHLSPWMPWVTNGYPRSAAKDFVQDADGEWGASFNYAIVVSGQLAGAASLMPRIGLAASNWATGCTRRSKAGASPRGRRRC